MPILLTIVLTYCVIDVCFGCQYTMRVLCCRKLNFGHHHGVNNVAPKAAKQAKKYQEIKSEIEEDNSKSPTTIRAP